MQRGKTVTWHALSFLVAAVLYFIFVLPRWWELTEHWSHGVGTAARIVTGLAFGAAALPVIKTLSATRKPELRTPQLALSLRRWSIIGHLVAGALIVVTAIAEIWIDLDTAGQWLFAVYGAALSVALLGAAAFYLAYLAELPPPPPKPLAPKGAKTGRRGRRGAKGEAEAADADEETAEATDEADDAEADESDADETAEADTEVADTEDESATDAIDSAAETVESDVAEVTEVVNTADQSDAETTETTEVTEVTPKRSRLRNRRSRS